MKIRLLWALCLALVPLLAAGQAWRNILKPLVLTAVGATFVGQAVAFFQQLRKGEHDFDE
mgnify:CR=1 FL=1